MAERYISQITLPGGLVYAIKDQEARDLIASIVAGGLTFVVSDSAATTPEGLEWDNNGTKVTGTLAASSSTKASIYLVPHKKTASGVDYYREYVTVNFGTESTPTWAWEFLGDTDIDLSGLGSLAYKNSASGSVSFTTADSASFSNGAVNASATYTPAGSVSVSLSQTATAASLTKGDYTPEGSVSVTLSQTSTAAALTKADYTPSGTVSTPTITVTPATDTVEVKKTAGSVTAGSAASFTSGTFSGGSFTQGTDSYVDPSFSATVANGTENLVISWSAGSFTQGNDSFTAATHGADTFSANTPTSVTLPTFEEATVVTGITSATATQPSFTGTKATGLQVTGVSYDKAGVQSATFTGTEADNILVTGVSYDKAGVQSAGFTGTEATISSTGTATGTVTLTKTEKTETVVVE